MRAHQLAEELPSLQPDDEVLRAAEMIADDGAAGVGVVNADGELLAVLAPCDVLRLLVPGPVQESPPLARVIEEPYADHVVEALRGRRLRELLPEWPQHIPVVPADATAIELGLVMVKSCSPVAVVRSGSRNHGAITAERLLRAWLATSRQPA